MDPRGYELTEDSPVYVISVAAEMSGMHPQTLRQYDRIGLVSPGRASGRGRRYSARDILRLREIQRLSQEEGINLAGVKRILDLRNAAEDLRRQVHALHTELARATAALDAYRRDARRRETDPDYRRVNLPAPLEPIPTTAVVVWRPGRGAGGR